MCGDGILPFDSDRVIESDKEPNISIFVDSIVDKEVTATIDNVLDNNNNALFPSFDSAGLDANPASGEDRWIKTNSAIRATSDRATTARKLSVTTISNLEKTTTKYFQLGCVLRVLIGGKIWEG